MQRVAKSWLVYRLTGSPAWLGIIGFSGNISTFLLVPFAGAIFDRSDKRRVLVITQALAALQAATLFVLVWTDTVQVWHLVGLSLILASVNALMSASSVGMGSRPASSSASMRSAVMDAMDAALPVIRSSVSS